MSLVSKGIDFNVLFFSRVLNFVPSSCYVVSRRTGKKKVLRHMRFSTHVNFYILFVNILLFSRDV